MKYMTVKEFLDSGLLFAINSIVLHPLGLAMSISIDEGGNYSFGDIWDCREEPEGIVYEREAFMEGEEKWLKYWIEFGKEKAAERRRVLGFVIQQEE